MAIELEVDETDVKNVIKTLENMLNDLDSFVDDTMKEIADEGSKYLTKRYQQGVEDPNLGEPIVMYSKVDNTYKLQSIGRGIVYREFGTGDEGERNPHVAKNKFKLKDYNSGGTITNIDLITNKETLEALKGAGVTSGNFWIYKNNSVRSNGSTYLTDKQKISRASLLINHASDFTATQGVRSGQEMWDTRNELIKNIIPKVGKKRGKEFCEKFKYAIKK